MTVAFGRRMTRWFALVMAMAALVVTGVTGCPIQDAQDRAECDKALDLVCGCSSKPCEANPPPAIVTRLRKCEGDDLRKDDYDLPTCINDRSDPQEYCRILDGLLTQSASTCSLVCNQDKACDQEDACHQFQYASCQNTVPASDGGVDASGD